jgi:hypothetical protein
MKKISILAAITLLLTHTTFAAPNEMTATNPENMVAETAPVDAINLPDVEDVDTSPVTDIDPITENESLAIDNHLKAVPKTDHDENSELHYTIDVTYPQIAGDNLSPAAQQFNQTISNMINEQVNQFKNSVKLDAVHMNTLPEEVRKNSFKIDYDIDVIKPDAQLSLVSVRLTIEGMQAGRPHPFHAHQVLNFDLTHGKEVALNDLFKKKSNYLSVIAKYSNQKLNQTLEDKWLIADGTKADAKNYKNWNLQGDSLLITFDEYQVAPYVAGPQEVEIPLTELTKILAINAPVMAQYKQPAPDNKEKALANNKGTEKIAAAKTATKKAPTSKTLG